MPAFKIICQRFFPTLIGLVFLGCALPRIARAAIPQAGQWNGEEVSVSANSNALANTYFPFMQRSMCTEVPEVVTIWTVTDSPIRVSCIAIVPSGVTLIIEAGVSVLFEDYAGLEIYGTLQAVGTEYGPIYFQPLKNNTPGSWGGVWFLIGSSGVLDHSILEYGGGYSGDGLVFISSDAVQVVDSVVQYSADAGIAIQFASPMISGTQILSNSVHGLSIFAGRPIIQNNTFRNNSTSGDTYSGGGGLYNRWGDPTIQNNIFIHNFVGGTDSYGGGLFNQRGNPTIQNNIFINNTAAYGGGLAISDRWPPIQNNTISDNSTIKDGGGLLAGGDDPVIQDNIFFDNQALNGGGFGNYSSNSTIRSNILVSNTTSIAGGGIYNDSTYSASATLDYNDVWNNAGGDYSGIAPGVHDISANPLLADPTNGDFHLSSGSPCIDAGDPVNYPATDFEGDPRPMGLAPDIGADEFRSLLTLNWRLVTMNPEIWMYWAAKR